MVTDEGRLPIFDAEPFQQYQINWQTSIRTDQPEVTCIKGWVKNTGQGLMTP